MNKNIQVKDNNYWWENENLHIVDINGNEYILHNPEILNIDYKFPNENEFSENVTLVGNNKVWEKPEV